MKFSTLFSPVTLLLAASTCHLASAQSGADSQIADDILAIDAAVRNLTATLSSYNGGIRESGPTVLSILNIHAVNRQAFTNAQASPSLNQAQSSRVTSVTKNSVGKSIPESIALTKAKKPLFDQAQLSSLVLSTLNLLQYDHDSFSLVVGSKLDPSNTLPAAAAAGAISASIAGGQAFYAL